MRPGVRDVAASWRPRGARPARDRGAKAAVRRQAAGPDAGPVQGADSARRGRRKLDDELLDPEVRLRGQRVSQRPVPGRPGEVRDIHGLGPCTRKNDYGGILFYGASTSPSLCRSSHGADVVSVEAVESPAGGDPSNISAACTYEDGTLVTLGLIGEGVYIFHMLAVGSHGIVEVPGTAQNYAADALSRNRAEGRETSTPSGSQAAPEADHYEKGARRILAVLRGEAPAVPHEQMLRSVQICTAIEESLVSGRGLWTLGLYSPGLQGVDLRLPLPGSSDLAPPSLCFPPAPLR